ncbi:hypothetical protein TWF694_009481 [Orbilia ellipsospora]|uniref:Protein prenylyltransferase n=1 Tax=Orbilia ellipsospora TaxID=2528407 RepID=A0AAV9XCA1_9PEZI
MSDRLQADEETRRDVFNRIASFFHTHRQDEVQIEILPFYPVPDTHIYVEDAVLAVGIPKSSLWKAFQHARLLFFDSSRSQSDLLSSSLVLILHDPEHITAINARKRLLLSLYPPQTPFPFDSTHHEVTPYTEYTLLTSILTSPLHRHTKSPHLWAHRRWLLTTYPSLKLPPPTPSPTSAPSRPSTSSSSTSKLLRKWCRKEITTILRAASTHPKNYYAWTYLRHLIEVIVPTITPLLHEEIVSWCIKHTGDISGWTFLAWLWLLERSQTTFSPSPSPPTSYSQPTTVIATVNGRRREDVLAERHTQLMMILNYSQNTAPGHESLWVFVREVVTRGVFDESVYNQRIVEMLQEWDARPWPGARAGEDMVKERILVREFLRDLYSRIAAAANAASAAAAAANVGVVRGDEDCEMVDLPP